MTVAFWGGNVRNNHACGRSGIASVKQTNHERPTVRPARLGFKMSKDPFGIVATVLGNSKNGDDDGEYTSKSPENGSGLSDDELATKKMRAGDD